MTRQGGHEVALCSGAKRTRSHEDWPRLRRLLRFLMAAAWRSAWLPCCLVATGWRSAWLRPGAPGTMRGHGWRGRWLGPEGEVDCAALAALIDSLRTRVAAEVAAVLGPPSCRSPCLYVFCGSPRLMAKWFDPLGMRTGTTLPHGMYCQGLGVLVGGDPTHREFPPVLAHEMCHAYVCLTVAGNPPSWASEGYAELVARQCLRDPEQELVEEALKMRSRGDWKFFVGLPQLFGWKANYTFQAGLFAAFLDACRAKKPEVWSVFVSALRGQIDGVPATSAAFEAAFGLPLCEIQQEFAKYCVQLVAGIELAEPLPTPPPIIPN